ncbi:MAG: ATP-binding protein [Bacteroidia bacterium]
MSHRIIKVLFVDDEEHNLASFRAAFRRDFHVDTCIDPEQATEMVGQNHYHVVVSDQRMPGLSGIDFFSRIHPSNPDQVKILCTAYADIQVLMDALNRGQVFRFVSKPWNEDELRVAIIDAYDQHLTRIKLKKSNEELRAALDELEKFIYTAAHDLRAPLLSIEGLIDLTRRMPQKQEEFIGRIDQSVRRLDEQLVKMVQYYKASNKNIEPEEILLEEEIKLVLESLRYQDASAGIRIALEVPPNLRFISDKVKLQAILNNLLSNAVKYADPAKSDRMIRVAATQENAEIRLVVEDNGIGISEENLSRVFGLFFTEGSRAKGSGLGLYIVHEAVVRLGGRIDIQSEKGKGTMFALVLPELKTITVDDF